MKKVFLAFAAVLLFSGCMSVNTQSSVRPTKAVFLDPEFVKPGKKVFVEAKSAKCAYGLGSLIKSELSGKGYNVVADSTEADIRVQTQVLFCDHKRENNKVIGGVLGAGAALGIAAHNHAGGWAKVGWSALGAAVGASLAHLSEDETWDLQVAVKITPKGQNSEESTIEAKASKMSISGDDADAILEREVAKQIGQMF